MQQWGYVHEIYVACKIYYGRKLLQKWYRDSVVRAIYAAEWAITAWIPGRFKRFFDSLEPSRLALGPIQTSSRWVPGFFPGVKAVGAWSLPRPSSVEVGMSGVIPTLPCVLMSWTTLSRLQTWRPSGTLMLTEPSTRVWLKILCVSLLVTSEKWNNNSINAS